LGSNAQKLGAEIAKKTFLALGSIFQFWVPAEFMSWRKTTFERVKRNVTDSSATVGFADGSRSELRDARRTLGRKASPYLEKESPYPGIPRNVNARFIAMRQGLISCFGNFRPRAKAV
jgi:hypothetical protein